MASITDFVRDAMNDLQSELDVPHCQESHIVFNNDESPADDVVLITRESIRKAYAFMQVVSRDWPRLNHVTLSPPDIKTKVLKLFLEEYVAQHIFDDKEKFKIDLDKALKETFAFEITSILVPEILGRIDIYYDDKVLNLTVCANEGTQYMG